MKPTEELVHEHEVILHVLKTAAAEAQRIRDGAAVRTALIGMMLDFFRNFSDKCHHAKEEKHLFPMLERRCLSFRARLWQSLKLTGRSRLSYGDPSVSFIWGA